MFRNLMSRLLRADLAPNVDWHDIDSMTVEARALTEAPRLLRRPEPVEQVLCSSANRYVLFKKWQHSGSLMRLTFPRALDGREMRITEMQPGSSPSYRLQIWPTGTTPVVCDFSRRTWFGLWHNAETPNVGPTICFIDSADRKLLVELRSKLLNGDIPEALKNEEEMWLRMNGMSDADRRAAMATLAMQAMGRVDHQFSETYPNLGPPPDQLKPALEMVQRRIEEIRATAAGKPVDPALEEMMKRFVADATQKPASNESEPKSGG
jgi:hypothetical protein